MSEKLDVYNDIGTEVIDIVDRKVVHEKGLLHKAVHCYIINPITQEVGLQRISDNKDSFPGFWDISAAGHVKSGETEEDSIIKEMKEELGLEVKIEDLELVLERRFFNNTIWHGKEFINNEINKIYVYFTTDLDIKSLVLQEDEVQDFKWFKFDDVKKEDEKFCMDFYNVDRVFNYTKQKYRDHIDIDKEIYESLKVVIGKLKEENKEISCMESCTGGGMMNVITNVTGVSDIFKMGVVTYSNEAKIKIGVDEKIIDKYTVYSDEVAKEMARVISDYSGSSYGIGITGQLNNVDKNNPVEEKDIVYICVYNKERDSYLNTQIHANKKTRKQNKDYVIKEAIDILNRSISI